MKIVSIVGTRPQFLKLASLSKCLSFKKIDHIVIHSGQHFDEEMSSNLFKILKIDKPKYNLEIHSMSHSKMTGTMIIKIEKILLLECPDYVIVYGDCDTTLAGGLVAVQMSIKLVHVEAGLRSYNKSMPEEINRIAVDHLADILCCPTPYAVENLKKEGIIKNVYLTGNLQIDLLKQTIKKYNNKSILNRYSLKDNEYILMTIHRHYNTNRDMIIKIFSRFKSVHNTIIFPAHPRTKILIEQEKIYIPDNIIMIKPVNYFDMTILERYCRYIITDSGGIQPESFYLKKPCLTLRTETEWTDTIDIGVNRLVEVDDLDDLNTADKEYDLPDYIKNDCSENITHILERLHEPTL